MQKLAAETFWRIPGRFGIARLFGSTYWLRCVVFHDISAEESPFTRGMGVNVTPADFEAALRFLTKYYNPVHIQDVLASSEGRGLPPRPVLVTFDDGYASVMERAVPLCIQLGVPAVFFLNAAFLDNAELAPDNLICFIANALGMETINAAARAVRGTRTPKLKTLSEVFSLFLPAISLAERSAFLDALADLGEIKGPQLAKEAGLYMTRENVRELANFGFEIGNHTYSHARCRTLAVEELDQEVARNKQELEALSGRNVRTFSLPYGSSADLTSALSEKLQSCGHETVFLSESVANQRGGSRFRFDRVSVQSHKDGAFFFEIEVMPRLRALRNRLVRAVSRESSQDASMTT